MENEIRQERLGNLLLVWNGSELVDTYFVEDEKKRRRNQQRKGLVCHRDGSLTYWSARKQVWVEKTYYISPEDLAGMNDKNRSRARKHLSKPINIFNS